MPSQIEVCNMALAQLGEFGWLTTLEDDSPPGRLCKLFWTPVKDACLQAYQWPFAMKRTALAQVGEPAFGFDYSYALPSDFLNAVAVDDDEYVYRIENGFLYTDEDEIYLRYIARLADSTIGSWPAVFISLLTARLAAEIAVGLTGKDTLRRTAWELYELRLREALGVADNRPDLVTSNSGTVLSARQGTSTVTSRYYWET